MLRPPPPKKKRGRKPKKRYEPITKWYHVSDNAKYVTAGHIELIPYQDGPFWKIKKYRGGQLPNCLSTSWTSFNECERDLIAFIKSKDKWGRAIYPGSPPRRKLLYVKGEDE